MSQPADADVSLVVYADYVCPFCYLGTQSLAQYRAGTDLAVGVDWRPFDLRSYERGPDGEIDETIETGKDAAYFDRVREKVEGLRAELGADEMRSIDDVPDVDSLDAQVASYYVERTAPEAWPAFDEALFEALWEAGRDIGDRDVLAAEAEAVGLDGEAVRAAVADETHREAVFEAFDAAEAAGVTGVPTFVHDGETVRGAVAPERLAALVEGE
jgi:predicted DsbA family dithiol-disulfide isomerase